MDALIEALKSNTVLTELSMVFDTKDHTLTLERAKALAKIIENSTALKRVNIIWNDPNPEIEETLWKAAEGNFSITAELNIQTMHRKDKKDFLERNREFQKLRAELMKTGDISVFQKINDLLKGSEDEKKEILRRNNIPSLLVLKSALAILQFVASDKFDKDGLKKLLNLPDDLMNVVMTCNQYQTPPLWELKVIAAIRDFCTASNDTQEAALTPLKDTFLSIVLVDEKDDRRRFRQLNTDELKQTYEKKIKSLDSLIKRMHLFLQSLMQLKLSDEHLETKLKTVKETLTLLGEDLEKNPAEKLRKNLEEIIKNFPKNYLNYVKWVAEGNVHFSKDPKLALKWRFNIELCNHLFGQSSRNITLNAENIIGIFNELKKENGEASFIHEQRKPKFFPNSTRHLKDRRAPDEPLWHTDTYQRSVKHLKEKILDLLKAAPDSVTRQDIIEKSETLIDYNRGNSVTPRRTTTTRDTIEKLYKADCDAVRQKQRVGSRPTY